MPDMPSLRAAALADARRALHECLSSLPAWAADEARAKAALLESAVRTAALAEAEAAIRAHVDSPLASALFSNGVAFAADLVHDLAATPNPTTQQTPCRCGHDRDQHDPDQCVACLDGWEQPWQHPYTAAAPGSADATYGHAPAVTCRCGADPVHQMGCDAE